MSSTGNFLVSSLLAISIEQAYICICIYWRTNLYIFTTQGEKALWSPWTGIVDWALVCKHFAKDFEKQGGKIFLNYEVTGFAETKETKGMNELAPISVQSKTSVSFTSIYNTFSTVVFRSWSIRSAWFYIAEYSGKICAYLRRFTFRPISCNDRMRS